MPIRVANLRLGIDEPLTWRILRKALDARSKDALRFVYHAEVTVPGDEARLVAHARLR